jgi:predicted CoA-binding protein/MOSC domain-containing protein YiiM
VSTEEEILNSSRVIAMVGLSAELERPSHRVAAYLKKEGYKIIPVNPGETEILGEVCYPNLLSISEQLDVVNIFRRSEEVVPIVKDAIKLGVKAVWMQEGVRNNEAATLAKQAGLRVIMDRCMMKEHRKLHKDIKASKLVAVCKSRRKGIRKTPVEIAFLKENHGLVGDAHADSATQRQVSLLAMESINKMRGLGFDITPGDFAENLTTEGIELASLPVGTHIHIGEVAVLEITQIGKECHTGCAIYKQIGKCIMPKEGVFARVIRGGAVNTGDQIRRTSRDGE